jgi:predicted nuclease of predicted toxin-antitoxin system
VKLLLDQNISRLLTKTLQELFPNSAHVSEYSLEQANDQTVWEFAVDNGFIIVSKDSDFHQRSFLHGSPPKVVWIRRGNCTTADIEDLLIESVSTIQEFIENPEATFLVLE